MDRGIIARVFKTERKSKESISFSTQITVDDLNYYSLYWDKIVLPTNSFITFSVPNEERLIESGILLRPRFQINKWSTHEDKGYFDLDLKSQTFFANKLIEEDKSTDWTIHQIGNNVILPREDRRVMNSIKVELLKCLPVPTGNVGIEKILKFKEDRKSELLALHDSIDKLYIDILVSADRKLKERKTLAELKKRLIDINNVSKEKFTFLSKYNLTTELNLDGGKLAALIGAGSFYGTVYSDPVLATLGTIGLGVLSAVKVKASQTVSLANAENKFKLSYIANASKNEIIK